ncbi:MAG: hypothetical protein LAT55_04590 [Opitutales bacterium]|nr:hypothetical protein [Opitutales bacterium]
MTLVKNSRFLLYVFVLGGLVFAMISGFGIFGAPTLEEQLERSAAEFNRNLPKEIHEDLRLRFVSAGPGEVLTYHFKLPKESREEIDVEALTATQSALLEANYAEAEEWTSLRERDVEIRYQFADQGGVPFLTLSTHRPPFDPREEEK